MGFMDGAISHSVRRVGLRFKHCIYREYLSLVQSMTIDREQEEEKRRDTKVISLL